MLVCSLKKWANVIHNTLQNIEDQWFALPFLKRFLCVFVCVGFVVIAMVVNALFGAGPLEHTKIVIIPNGSGLAQIAQRLKDAGVIKGIGLLKITAHGAFISHDLKAGEYEFQPRDSMWKVLNQLKDGQVVMRSITFPEGMTSAEIVAVINANDGLKGDPVQPQSEGALLPETYTFSYGESRASLVNQMRNAMTEAVNIAWESRAKGVPLKSKNDLVTLASIVEKETGLDHERAAVAGVYTNRLHKGMRLQADPTVIYGAKNYDGNLTKKHLRDPHPYNTYRHKGLPPGPIANPGVASLMAAAQPEAHDYIYFVADGHSGHWFARTNAEHQRNVRRYLKIYREKNGK